MLLLLGAGVSSFRSCHAFYSQWIPTTETSARLLVVKSNPPPFVTEALRGSSGIGKVREFADAKELRRRSDQRYDLCEEMHKQREVLRQREEVTKVVMDCTATAYRNV